MKSIPTKTLLFRTSLIIAIACGIAVATLNIIKVKGRITKLQTDLSSQTAARNLAEGLLASTRRDLGTALSSLTETRATLEVATTARQKAETEARAKSERLKLVTQSLDQTTHERDDARAYLERYQLSGMEPEEVVKVGRELKTLRTALTSANQTTQRLSLRVRHLEEQLTPGGDGVILPAGLKGKILVYDPKWQFVVLDAGENQGMLTNSELLVIRKGQLVGKVKVSRVQDDRSIANLMPGWQLGDVLEGDVVIPAHSKS